MPPFDAAMANRHKKGLSPKQVRQWVAVAQSMYDRCMADGGEMGACEARAIRAANGVTGEPRGNTGSGSGAGLRQLTINVTLTAEPKHLMLNNIDYLTAPCVMIVSGVLNGGLIAEEELVPSDWNNCPVTIGHATDAVGNAISARAPQVLASRGVGHVYHVRLGSGTRGSQQVASLVGELWLDTARMQAMGGEALEALTMLEQETPLEVSTGFYSTSITARGSFLGTQYVERHTQLRPDHLALLPNAIGACSLTDGCGALKSNTACTCGGTCSACQGDLPMDAPSPTRLHALWTMLSRFFAHYPAHPDEALVTEQAHCPDCGSFLPAVDGGTDVTCPKCGTVMTMQTDVDLRQALYGALAREMGDEMGQEVYQTPFMIQDLDVPKQTFTYRMGERLMQRAWTTDDAGVVSLAGDPQDVQADTRYIPVQAPVTEEESSMPTEVIQRRVNALIANERTQWSEQDRHLLEAQDEAFLIRLEQQPLAPAVKTAPPATIHEAIATMPNHLQEPMQAMADEYDQRKTAAIQVLVATKRCPFSEEELQGMTAQRVEDLVVMAGAPVPLRPGVQAVKDYSGRGGPARREVSEAETVPPAPKTLARVVEMQRARGLIA